MFADTPESLRSSPTAFLPGPFFAALTLLFGLVACDAVGPTTNATESGSAPLSISFTAESGSAAKAAQPRTFTDPQGNTLQLDRVEMVIQEMEFDRANGRDDCDEGEGNGSEEDCEDVESGPVLVSLPLESGAPTVVIDTTLPVGKWEKVKFEVEEAEEGALEAGDFPAEVSIRAQGTFTPASGTAQDFTFTSDLSAEREIEFEPPVEVTRDEPTNITFSVDVNTWFRQSDSTLVDPAQAGDEGAFEDLVEENIETSIEGFEDDDRDGENDDENEEEGENEDEDEEEDENDDEDEEEEEEEEGEDEDDAETEIERALNNTGPDADASGEAEFEKESDRTEFKVEVEGLDTGTYEVVVADTTRGQLEVVETDDGTEGEIEFRTPSEDEHPLLDFDPRGAHVAVEQNGTVYLEVDFPTGDGNDDDEENEEETETEIEVELDNSGPDADASGEAEFEKEEGRSEFNVEVEDLAPGTYDVVVADTSRGQIDVVGGEDEAEGEIEFRDPAEEGHPLLDFDPRGAHVAVEQEGTVFLEVDFPAENNDGEDEDENEDDEDEEEEDEG